MSHFLLQVTFHDAFQRKQLTKLGRKQTLHAHGHVMLPVIALTFTYLIRTLCSQCHSFTTSSAITRTTQLLHMEMTVQRVTVMDQS